MRLALVLALAVVTLAPAGARAQQRTDGPRIQRAGISRPIAAPATADREPEVTHHGTRTDAAMMIVGGTAFLVGMSLDGRSGEIITISGAVIGLIGLIRYIR